MCPAAILYVQVEGESQAGAVRLLPDDLMEEVVDRAVEKKRIPSIFWVDVAGWELWGSRAKVGRPIQSGTSSEPLSDLPDFPSKSLLVLTRRSIPPTSTTSSGRASSTSASSSLPSSSSYSQPVLSPSLTAPVSGGCLTRSASPVSCARCVVQR
jgi:hypothetical protein